jgi:hypothetical protein
MRAVNIHDEARIELGDIAVWYNAERPGLGDDFWQCVQSALDVLESDVIVPDVPMAGVMGKRGVRRLLVDCFPYSVVFVQHADEVTVLAFAHHKRKPNYWRARMK